MRVRVSFQSPTMPHDFAVRPPPLRLTTILACLAVSLFASGYTSCAGTTGPLLGPRLSITPSEVLLRASLATKQEAIALARVDGAASGDRFTPSIEYGRGASSWLTVEVSGNDLTLRANPGGTEPATYRATVTVQENRSGDTASLQVEFTVIP